VSDPAKTGSDKQSQQFQASFQKELAVINGHLQYTSANAEAARHGPLEARRDALYPAFQGALGQIDRTNPAKAQGAIDKVLADVKALCAEVTKFRHEAEKALNDWKARQVKYDAAVHQVEELEAWGDAKAPPLRGLVDGIRTQVNERKYAPACTVVDQLLPKLKPIYDDYLKQKAAKPKCEQALAEKSARLDALKAAERPSAPITAKAGEAGTALQQARTKADAKDFVGACDLMKPVQAASDALDKLVKDPQRVKFLADRKVAEEAVNAPADIVFKTLEADWNAILQARAQSDPAADSGDYAGANKTLADLEVKLTAYKKKVDDLKQKKKAYDDALAALQPRFTAATQVQPQYAKLDAMQKDMVAVQGQMEAAAKSEDFVKAAQTLKDLTTKLVALEKAKAEIDKQKQTYEAALKAAQMTLAELNGHAQKPNFTTEIAAIDTKLKAAKAKGDANDFDEAVKLAQQVQSSASQTNTTMDMVKKGLAKARAEEVADVSQSLIDSGVDREKAVEVGQVTHAGGSGDVNDEKLVAKEVAMLPTAAIKTMNANGTKVVACRGSITDHRTDLAGETPRGWPAGSTWDSVPGVFLGDTNEVVIATTGHGTAAGAKVPPTGHGHGAFDLAAHESMHGYDLGGTGDKKHSDPAFVTARTKDMSKLGRYFKQAGDAGLEETFAESAARYYGGDPKMKNDWPNLWKYWDSQPK
jgi:hypothetical protein